jgi:hypothetical protein
MSKCCFLMDNNCCDAIKIEVPEIQLKNCNDNFNECLRYKFAKDSARIRSIYSRSSNLLDNVF